MADSHGNPIWYEYLAADADAARAFYAEVVGWSIASGELPGIDYRILTAPDGSRIGGLMRLPDGAPMRPGWLGYFSAEDVDATVTKAEALGATVLMPAMTMEGAGRMALLADPDGAAFYVMRGMGDVAATAFQTGDTATPGHVVWNELTTPDQDAAMAFYASLFGWRHEGGMPMGVHGDYRFVHAGSVCLGATMRASQGATPCWRFFFLVDDIDAASDRLKQAGGLPVQGPDPIPGGAFSMIAKDNAGARFGLVGPRL